MSRELLKINRLPTISEFAYLLLEALDGDGPVQQHDLSALCKAHSFNLARSFDDGIRFLLALSLIQMHANDTIARSLDGKAIWEVKDHQSLCLFITKRFIDHLRSHGLLEELIGISIVDLDEDLNTFYIQTSAIPLEYPMFSLFFLRMGIASLQANSKTRIVINDHYKPFFEKEILLKKDRMPKTNPAMNSVSIFISYAHKDERYKDELVKHLSSLKRQGLVHEWNDRQLVPGNLWDQSIREKLEAADIILFLVSADLMASNYINDVEIKKAFERYESGKVKIVPVFVRPCDHDGFQVSRFQGLPKDALPISKWTDQDEAYLDVVQGIKKILAGLNR